MFLQRLCKITKTRLVCRRNKFKKKFRRVRNKKINLKETGWRKNKVEKFLTLQKQFEERKFEQISDAQKQTVSYKGDKFETSMFLTRQKQVEENTFEKFLTCQKQENKFKTWMFLTPEVVWKKCSLKKVNLIIFWGVTSKLNEFENFWRSETNCFWWRKSTWNINISNESETV